MDFLDQIFLDNSIKSYLTVFAIILFAWILKTIISKYATALLFKMGKAQWRGMSKARFDDIIVNPVERVFIVLVIVFSMSTLKFPTLLQIHIFRSNTMSIVHALAVGVIIYCLSVLILRFMDFIVAVVRFQSKYDSPSEHQLLYFFKDLIRVVIIIFSGLFILKFSFRVNIGNLLTGLSIVGAAIALSARESLENLIASFVIFFDKPFKTGDTVKIKEFSGVIERIGLRSTRIRTTEKSLITVPNKQMVDNILDNWSDRYLIRSEFKTTLPATLNPEQVNRLIITVRELFKSDERIVSSSVFLNEYVVDAAVVSSVFFTPLSLSIDEVNEIKQSLQFKVRAAIEELIKENNKPEDTLS